MNEKPIDKLHPDDQVAVYEVQKKLMEETATAHDIGVIMRVAQQNVSAFGNFGLTLILRIAEVHFQGRKKVDYIYTLENLNAAFGLDRN
ncbi:hypothetical protein [Paenibacillus lactis]|uniref:hypothetical protein n=1 Tax=Paenibacillus lactis TaxID=228574 RepID=UPI003D71ACCC